MHFYSRASDMIDMWIVHDPCIASVGGSFEFDLDKTIDASGITRPSTIVTNAPIDNTPADNLRSMRSVGSGVWVTAERTTRHRALP